MTSVAAPQTNPILARRAAKLPGVLPAAAPAVNLAFDSGHAFPDVLPDLREEALLAVTKFRLETLQYAPRPGLLDLRRHIASYMAAGGTGISPDQILVTNGAKHAIDLACRLLLDEGDSIIVTAPTYFTAIPIFRSFGVRFIEIAQDSDGLDVSELAEVLASLERAGERMPKFLYNVPDFHNPTGVTMPLERRQALLELAVHYGFLVIEDSPYRNVRFAGQSLPTLKALDSAGVVLHVGTFSKLMAPGLRVGWMAATPPLIARMIQLKSDGGSCPLTQRIIVEFLRAGRLDAHIAHVQRVYGSNRDRMLLAVKRELPDAAVVAPDGGYYLWLTLPEQVDGDRVAREASLGGVTLLPGSKFFARSDADHPRNHLRLAYSHASHEEIDDGIRRLCEAYRAVTAADASPALR